MILGWSFSILRSYLPWSFLNFFSAATGSAVSSFMVWRAPARDVLKLVAHDAAVMILGGTALVTGGLYQGAAADSTEQSYAALNGDGSVAAFTTLAGSHTIVSAGGSALFNQTVATYADSSGVAHVIVLGGDDVNAPGTKRAEVWVY